MLRVRDVQIEALAKSKKEASYRRLAAELRESSPFATSHLSDDQLLAMIEQSALKAQIYGATSSHAITAFVKMSVFAGRAFDQDPDIRRYLETPDLDPDYKIVLLAETVCKTLGDRTDGS